MFLCMITNFNDNEQMMMSKKQTNFRIDTDAKQQAYNVLARIGLSPTEAVNMFMHYIAMYGELPFHPRIPNAETLAALKETDHPEKLKTYSLEEFKKSLEV